MLGNSLTENGGDWAARLGNKHVRNRGIIGDEVMGVYDRLHQILPGQPAKLFLLIGVNDVSPDLTAGKSLPTPGFTCKACFLSTKVSAVIKDWQARQI